MDTETFEVMWEMSQNEAKGCFLRLSQIEYYCVPKMEHNALEKYPDVSRSYPFFATHKTHERGKSSDT